MDPLKIYDYLTKARERVFDAVRALPPQDYSREFAIGLKTLGTTLTHMMIVEWSYSQRIAGLQVPPYDTWPIQDENPPPFEVIEKTWREQAVQTRATLAAVKDWDREMEYTSKSREGQQTIITVSPADIFTQMLVHEVHHRAQIMAMLREVGSPTGPLENLDFGYLMYKRRVIEE
jgi:uncharacterized damage-inducible protein DinB